MGDTWITDLSHFAEALDPASRMTGPARRLRLFLGSIVEDVTRNPHGEYESPRLPCRRRPKRKPCPGEIASTFDPDDESAITWFCTACNDNGEIRGWKGTAWDRTGEKVDSSRGWRVLRGGRAGPSADGETEKESF